MDQNAECNEIQTKTAACPKSDHANMLVSMGIYSVFRGSVHHGGYVHIYIYTYTCFLYLDVYAHVMYIVLARCTQMLEEIRIHL